MGKENGAALADFLARLAVQVTGAEFRQDLMLWPLYP